MPTIANTNAQASKALCELQRGECRRKTRQCQRGRNACDGDAHFKDRVQPVWTYGAVGEAPQHQSAQRQSTEEGGDRGRDRIDLDAHHQRELLDPDHLIDQRGDAGQEQEHRSDGEFASHAPHRGVTCRIACTRRNRVGSCVHSEVWSEMTSLQVVISLYLPVEQDLFAFAVGKPVPTLRSCDPLGPDHALAE